MANEKHFRSEDPGWDEYAEKAIWKKPAKESVDKALPAYVGQFVAVLCKRYFYRGMVKSVGDGVMILCPAYCVEISGEFTGDMPRSEDFIPRDLLVPLAQIEILCQPAWVHARSVVRAYVPPDAGANKKMSKRTLKDALKAMGACSGAIEWVGDKNLETAWNKCKDPPWVGWFCSKRLSGTHVDVIDGSNGEPYKGRLKKMGACQEFVDWIGERDFATAWAECPSLEWIEWMRDKKLESLGDYSSSLGSSKSNVNPEWTRAEALAFEKPAKGLEKAASAYLGQAVATLCPQWVYRGIVKRVEDGVIVLHHAHGVCVTGPASSNRPLSENPIKSDLFIPLAAFEILFQPSWASYGIGGKA